MRRRLAILLLALLGSLCASIFLTPSTASAIGLDCKESPTPEVPGRGLTGFFQSEPKPLPAARDPFAPNAKTTIYEQYGYAGLRWTTYDLGCGPDSARAPDATAGTAVANWLFLVPKAGVAFTNAVVEVALRPRFLGEFDPLVSRVSNVLYRTLFSNWVPVALVATGALLIWRARRADLATSTAAVAWAAFVMIAATALFQWPLQAGRAADSSVTATLTAVSGQLARGSGSAQTASEKTAASNTHEALLYQAWLAGTFGKGDTNTANTYGPELFDASALTWREARTLRQDPARGKSIIDAKRQKFSTVAEKVKNADPDAYEYLTGKRSETRVGYALIAIFGAFCALPFLLGAFLVVLAAFLVVRFAVMLFPAFAVLALFPAMRRVVTTVGSIVAAALFNAVIFGVAAIAVLRAIGILLDPNSPLPQWLSLTLMLLVSLVMWFLLRPVRRLGSMLLSGPRVGAAGSADEQPTQRHGRHVRVEDSARQEAGERSSSEPLRSEIHSIADTEPSARLPDTYQFKEPDLGPSLPPGAAPAGVPSANGRDGGGGSGGGSDVTAVATPPAPSRNGRSAAASEGNPLEEPAREEVDQESIPPPRTPAEAHQRALRNPLPRRPSGGDGAGIPLAARPAAEESGGPIYVPDRGLGLNSGTDRGARPVRLEDEPTSPVYRPTGKGRAPTKPGE
jgi:hypothetical protein